MLFMGCSQPEFSGRATDSTICDFLLIEAFWEGQFQALLNIDRTSSLNYLQQNRNFFSFAIEVGLQSDSCEQTSVQQFYCLLRVSWQLIFSCFTTLKEPQKNIRFWQREERISHHSKKRIVWIYKGLWRFFRTKLHSTIIRHQGSCSPIVTLHKQVWKDHADETGQIPWS